MVYTIFKLIVCPTNGWEMITSIYAYSHEVDKTHPKPSRPVPYKDPLWAMMDISKDGSFQLKGKSRFLWALPPEDAGMSPYQIGYLILPFISDRNFACQKVL